MFPGLNAPHFLSALRSLPRHAQSEFKFAKFGGKQSELILAKAKASISLRPTGPFIPITRGWVHEIVHGQILQ